MKVTPSPDIYVIEPLTWLVLAIAALLVTAAVALWLREAEEDRRFAARRIQDTRDADATRRYVAGMRSRRLGVKLDGTAADTGSMRKATL
jgi:Flp pilus assembly protein TadB